MPQPATWRSTWQSRDPHHGELPETEPVSAWPDPRRSITVRVEPGSIRRIVNPLSRTDRGSHASPSQTPAGAAAWPSSGLLRARLHLSARAGLGAGTSTPGSGRAQGRKAWLPLYFQLHQTRRGRSGMTGTMKAVVLRAPGPVSVSTRSATGSARPTACWPARGPIRARASPTPTASTCTSWSTTAAAGRVVGRRLDRPGPRRVRRATSASAGASRGPRAWPAAPSAGRATPRPGQHARLRRRSGNPAPGCRRAGTRCPGARFGREVAFRRR